MAISQVGTPPAVVYTTTAGTNTPTLAWGTGQTRTAGDLLVLVVTAGAVTSVTAPSTPANWTAGPAVGNAGTANARVAIFYRVATGGDGTPAISVTTSGTTRCGFSLFEFSGVNTSTGPFDTTGTYASGASSTISSMTVTSGANVSIPGEYAIAAFARKQGTAATATWTPGSNWVNFGFDGVTSALSHLIVDTQASPAAGGTLSDAGTITSATSSFAAGVIAVLLATTGLSGGPLSTLTGPQGSRVFAAAQGVAMATVIPVAVALATPAPAPVLHAPVAQGIPQGTAGQQAQLPPRGRVHRRSGTYEGVGPPVTPLKHPVQAAPPLPPRGRVYSRSGTYEGTGPAVKPLSGPVAARTRVLPLRGAAYSRPGTPQGSGPPVTPLQRPVTARVRILPPRGTAQSRAGTYQGTGPAFPARSIPVTVRFVLPARGRTLASALPPASAAPPNRTVAYPLRRPVRVNPVLPARGRVLSTPAYVPPLTAQLISPLSQPAAIRVTAYHGGWASNRPVPVPATPVSAPVRPLTRPVRAVTPLPPHGKAMTMAAIPAPVIQATAYPLHKPVRAAPPLPPRGRVTASPVTAVPANLTVAYPLHRPVRAAPPLPPHGKAQAIVAIPAPVSEGPAVIYPLRRPVKAAPPLPPHGRAMTMAAIPAPIAEAVAVAYPLHKPVRAQPPLPPHGKAQAIVAIPAPVQPPVNLTVAYPLQQPAGPRVFVTRTGLGQGRLGAPFPATPAPVLHSPVRARVLPLPKGSAQGRQGHFTAVANLTVAYPLHSPVRTRVVLPPAGHAHFTPPYVIPAQPSGRPLWIVGAPFSIWNAGVPQENWQLGPSAQLWYPGEPLA